ncbi:MAG: hypothetical protein AAGA55_05460 [Planctomycetota bacterium]
MKEHRPDNAALHRNGTARSETGSGDPVSIARQLTGDLSCVGCGYNLRGLSVREMCPECGMPVRATILGVVDPKAHQLIPLAAPMLTAVGMVAWALGGWIAVITVATMRIAEIMRSLASADWWPALAPVMGAAGLVVSGLGALTMIRPHRGITRVGAILAALGVAAYIPLTLIYFQIYARFDASAPTPFMNPGPMQFDRSALRLGMFVAVVILLLGLRNNARGLSSRSVIVRTGRIDRQSILALLASFFVAAIGDALSVVAFLAAEGMSAIIAAVGTVFVAVGSVLVVVGATNILIDVWRLWPVVVRRGVGLGDVLESNVQRDRRAGA